ncbi:dipeptide ABC transporter ATP-binding protein [Embleya hyalina]|uniref:ABC transporter ATP-binding protein n=1 Tax=Embleya hyalina TaxID=516124 RepID=A0A401Z1Q0_9ACTN|nr:ABC transporter ATP-binding protein [Embleya hyalina]GCE00762.1 ABC transporter ATP-binding protein [Embleya hyalina]
MTAPTRTEPAATGRRARTPLVEIAKLRVDFGTGGRRVRAVDAVDLSVAPGECLALVGESGSGKSVTARALVGLAGPRAHVSCDRMLVDGRDATRFDARAWRGVRGRRIGFVLQDALVSLDVLRTVGAEVAEPLRTHAVVPRGRVHTRVLDLLADAGIPDPARRVRQYPHQLSGGLRQRALIASALAAEPALLIADEPTTALDVTVQAQILDLLADKRAGGMGLLLISHDLAVVSRVADRVAVMRDGVIVEQGPAARVLTQPEHPYTRLLLAAVPSGRTRGRRLSPGPDDTRPEEPTHTPRPGSDPTSVTGPRRTRPAHRDTPLVEAHAVGRSFTDADGSVRDAVREFAVTIHPGEAVGLVGESGSGKTTAARLLLGLVTPDTGTVRFDGRPWSTMPERARRPLRRRLQVITQDPLGSFDPRWSVGRLLGEALGTVGVRRGAARRERTVDLLLRVGLAADHLGRRPATLSGGQRQRVAIARALATEPQVLVCDEPVSALDVSVQAQVLDLLADLRESHGLALLFISHDLGVVHHVCDRVLVMHDGRVVEQGDVDRVFADPEHAYTRTLLHALPGRDLGPGASPAPPPPPPGVAADFLSFRRTDR